MDTDGGLVVPVIRDAEHKGIVEISRDLADISTRAREHALAAEELSGASFTISSLDGIGGTALPPIVNRPQVAILGVPRSVVALDIAGGQEVVLPSTSAGEPAEAARDELSTFLAGDLDAPAAS